MKDSVTKFDLEAAFKALEDIEYAKPVKATKQDLANARKIVNLNESMNSLMEDFYDLEDEDSMNEAAEEREGEIAQAKLARIEKIVDLDAKTANDLLPSYVGKIIIQCPQCMNLFYKNEEDLEKDPDDPETCNVNEPCQHCGNISGYSIIGKVDEVSDDEMSDFTDEVSDDEADELNLNFDAEEEPADEDSLDLDLGDDMIGEEDEAEDTDLDLDLDLDNEEKNESLNNSKAAKSDNASETAPSENKTLNEAKVGEDEDYFGKDINAAIVALLNKGKAEFWDISGNKAKKVADVAKTKYNLNVDYSVDDDYVTMKVVNNTDESLNKSVHKNKNDIAVEPEQKSINEAVAITISVDEVEDEVCANGVCDAMVIDNQPAGVEVTTAPEEFVPVAEPDAVVVPAEVEDAIVDAAEDAILGDAAEEKTEDEEVEESPTEDEDDDDDEDEDDEKSFSESLADLKTFTIISEKNGELGTVEAEDEEDALNIALADYNSDLANTILQCEQVNGEGDVYAVEAESAIEESLTESALTEKNFFGKVASAIGNKVKGAAKAVFADPSKVIDAFRKNGNEYKILKMVKNNHGDWVLSQDPDQMLDNNNDKIKNAKLDQVLEVAQQLSKVSKGAAYVVTIAKNGKEIKGHRICGYIEGKKSLDNLKNLADLIEKTSKLDGSGAVNELSNAQAEQKPTEEAKPTEETTTEVTTQSAEEQASEEVAEEPVVEEPVTGGDEKNEAGESNTVENATSFKAKVGAAIGNLDGHPEYQKYLTAVQNCQSISDAISKANNIRTISNILTAAKVGKLIGDSEATRALTSVKQALSGVTVENMQSNLDVIKKIVIESLNKSVAAESENASKTAPSDNKTLNESSDTEISNAEYNELLNSSEFQKPISDTEVETILDEVDADELDEIDEESVEDVVEESLKSVYENVKSFTLGSCDISNNKLVLEGIIMFNSGNTRATSYKFNMPSRIEKTSTLSGTNSGLANGSMFEMAYTVAGTKLIVESLSYKYTANGHLFEGLVKRNK